MPELSDLYAKYKDNGLKVFGLNSVDNQPKSIKYLNRFLNNRTIEYDIIMIEPEVDLKYKINGYPALYLINLDGNISYVELGYDKKTFEEFKSKVIELLKKKYTLKT